MHFGQSLRPLDYAGLQNRGARWQRWLDHPSNTSCPVLRSTLTLDDLVRDGWLVEMESSKTGWRTPSTDSLQSLPRSVREVATGVGLPNGRAYRVIIVRKGTTAPDGSPEANEYEVMVGPGCIFAMFSERFDGKNWSDIALAVYRHFQEEKLRYVFRVDVVNEETKDLVTKQLYPQKGLRWPDHKPRVWKHGTPEYKALLGTVNGRGVAALVLGGFERGTKTIREVHTWAAYGKQFLQVMIPISDVE